MPPQGAAALSTQALSMPFLNGDINKLAPKVREFVLENAAVCQPDNVYLVDGSDRESDEINKLLVKAGIFTPLSKMETWSVDSDSLTPLFTVLVSLA